MNRQINYIIHAFLLIIILLLPAYFVINKIIFSNVVEENNNRIIDNSNKSGNLNTTTSLNGKYLFLSKCASCHSIFKDMTGPALMNFEERGAWADRKKLYEWIRNPGAFMSDDPYTKGLKAKYGSMMVAFPDITNEDINAICDYINQSKEVRYSMPMAKR
jgi:Cytochrome c